MTGCIPVSEHLARKDKQQQQIESMLVRHDNEKVHGSVSIVSRASVTSADATQLIAAMGIEVKETHVTENRLM